MSLFHFLFPEVAQAEHLDRLARATEMANAQSRLSHVRLSHQKNTAEKRIQELESEVAQLTLVLEALIEKLTEDAGLTRDDLAAKIAEIDLRDGVADGRITPPPSIESPKSKPKLNFPK